MPRLLLETERMANLNSGLGQLCLHLGREIVRQKPADWELIFVVHRDQVGIFGPTVKYITAARWRRFWRFWKFDVWHCLYQDTRFYPILPTRFIYTILDLNFLSIDHYSAQRKARRKRHYQARIDQATIITTISEYVKQEVRRQLTVPPQTMMHTVYCGVDSSASTRQTPPIVRPGGPFLFFIGMLQPYKNVHTMLPLLVDNPTYWLVLAGPDKPAYSEQIRTLANELGVADRLLITGPIDEPTKWWYYANCEAFLFPSLMEGFGIPVVEAMTLSKPVFSSALTSLPEVGGKEAFYFPDFTDKSVVETFRRGMKTYRNDPDMPARLHAQSQLFHWEKAAAAYWQLYQDMMHHHTA